MIPYQYKCIDSPICNNEEELWANEQHIRYPMTTQPNKQVYSQENFVNSKEANSPNPAKHPVLALISLQQKTKTKI